MDFETMPCDPLSFYQPDTKHLDQETEDFIKTVIFAIVCSFIIITTPFLIVLPFISSQLNTLTRKVISMIVLCDFLVALLSLFMIISKAVSSGQRASLACWVVAILFNYFLTCSLTWTCLLLLNIYLNSADHKTSTNRRKLHYIFHILSWSTGALVNIPNYMHYSSYSVTYRPNYLFEVGCHLNFTFMPAYNGTACLITSEGAQAITVFYSSWAVIIVLIWLLFVLAVRRAHKNWAVNRELATKHHNSREGNIGYIIATEAAYNTYRNCLKFMVPGLIYSIAFVPVVMKELYGISHGEIKSLYLKTFYAVWYACFGVFVALMNLVFYGLGSANFRQELKHLWEQLTYEFRIRQRGGANTSRSWLYTSVQSGTQISSDNDFRHGSHFGSDATGFELNY